MGNQSKRLPQAQFNNKIILHLRQRTIILHHAYKMKLEINDVGVFPHGLDGLKLWQTNIIGARYAIINNDIFKGKDVLEVNSGVGICGISINKWTKAKSVLLTDFHDEVVQNIRRNCQKNDAKDVSVYKINLKEPKSFKSTFDVIMGNDLIHTGCLHLQLYQLINKYLNPSGKVILIVPQRPNDLQLFLSHFQQADYTIKKIQLVDQQYEMSPLANKVQSLSQFPLIGELNFITIHIIRKPKLKPQKLYKIKEENQEEYPQQTKQNKQLQHIIQQPQSKQQKTQKQQSINSKISETIASKNTTQKQHQSINSQTINTSNSPIHIEKQPNQQQTNIIQNHQVNNVIKTNQLEQKVQIQSKEVEKNQPQQQIHSKQGQIKQITNYSTNQQIYQPTNNQIDSKQVIINQQITQNQKQNKDQVVRQNLQNHQNLQSHQVGKNDRDIEKDKQRVNEQVQGQIQQEQNNEEILKSQQDIQNGQMEKDIQPKQHQQVKDYEQEKKNEEAEKNQEAEKNIKNEEVKKKKKKKKN